MKVVGCLKIQTQQIHQTLTSLKSFLQDEMIDLGKGSYPAFFDYNGDGLDDLVVGNYGYHVNNNNPISSLALFENIGTSSFPEYDLIDEIGNQYLILI